MTYDTYLYANLLNGRSPCKVYTYSGRWDRDLGPEEELRPFKSAKEHELEHALLEYLRDLRIDLNRKFNTSAWIECEARPENYELQLGKLNIDGNIYDLCAGLIPRD